MGKRVVIDAGMVLNGESAKILKSKFIKMAEAGYDEFDIEMENLSYINIAGLASIFYISKIGCENGYTVRLLSPKSTIKKVLKITNADMYARIAERKDEIEYEKKFENEKYEKNLGSFVLNLMSEY